MLSEDVRMLGQRQRTFITQGSKSCPDTSIVFSFLHQYPKAWFPQGDTQKASQHLYTWWVALEEKSPEFSVSESFVLGVSMAVFGSEERHSLPSKTMSKPALCSGGETPSLSSKYIHCKNILIIDDNLKHRVPLLTWCIKLRETPRLY